MLVFNARVYLSLILLCFAYNYVSRQLGSILINVKCNDGRWSTPAIIPPSGSSNGVIRVHSSRWPQVTSAIKKQKLKGSRSAASNNSYIGDDAFHLGSHSGNLGMAPLEPSVYELIYQVTVLSGLWGELSRILTVTPR